MIDKHRAKELFMQGWRWSPTREHEEAKRYILAAINAHQPTEEKDEYEILLPPLHFAPGKPLTILKSTGELSKDTTNVEG